MTPEPQKKNSAITYLNSYLLPRKDAYINRLTAIKNELQPSFLHGKKKTSSSVRFRSCPSPTPSSHSDFTLHDIHHNTCLKIAQPHSLQPPPPPLKETHKFSVPSHPNFNANRKPISGRASPPSLKLYPTASLNSFTLLSSFTKPSPDQDTSDTSTVNKSSSSACKSGHSIQTISPPKLIHIIPAFPIQSQKQTPTYGSTISPNVTFTPNPTPKSLFSHPPASCLSSKCQRRKPSPNKKFRRLELVRQAIASYKNKIQVVSPLRYAINNKYKESLMKFKCSTKMDQMAKNRAFECSESQTEVTSIYDNRHKLFSPIHHPLLTVLDNPKSSPHLKKASETLLPERQFKTNFLNRQLSLRSSLFHANSLHAFNKKRPLLKGSTRNPSHTSALFKESNFFKNSYSLWGFRKTTQFMYSKDLEERCKRIIASVETSPRSRRSTDYAPSTLATSSQPRRRSASAPPSTLSHKKKHFSLSKVYGSRTTKSMSCAPSSSVVDALLSINLRSHSSRWSLKKPCFKKRKLFKGPHRFSLIPKLIRPRLSLLHSQLQALSTRPKPLKTTLLRFDSEKSTPSPIKKRTPLRQQRKQNKYFAKVARTLEGYLKTSDLNQPLSLATTFSQFYYIPRPSLPTPKKPILTNSLKSVRLPTPPPTLPSWAQPRPLPEKKIKKESKERVLIPQPTSFKIISEEKINEPKVLEKILIQETLISLNEMKEEEVDIKEENVAQNFTDTFIPSASTFKKSQRVLFLQDFTRLTKWYEDIMTKNFVNNNMYSLDVDTRKIEEFSENDFREMVWNLYYYLNRMGNDMLMSPFCYKELFKFSVSKYQDDVKNENCRLLIKELPKLTYLNLKSIFGHSFRLSKVALNNNMLLGILFTTLGRILFPILELDTYKDGIDTPPPTPTKSPTSSNSAISRPRRTSTSTLSFQELSSVSASSNSSLSRLLSLAPSKLSPIEHSNPLNFKTKGLEGEEALDLISMNIRDPIDTKLEESKLNEIKKDVLEVVTAILQGGTLEEHLSAGGKLVKYLVENFESLF